MKTIKKTTLIAAVAAMAAFAVPSMASAAVWGPAAPPPNNKTMTASFPTAAKWYTGGSGQFSFECTNSSLGVRVRNPASSTLDITSASFSGCNANSTPPCGPATVTATGLPWPVTTSGTTVTFTQHLLVTEAWCAPGYTLNVDGPVTGTYSNATHSFTVGADYPNMKMTYMGSPLTLILNNPTTTWHETTNTLTLT